MSQNQLEQQLEKQFKKLLKQIQPKPTNCHDHKMDKDKCKNCVYNIGIYCDM